MLFLVSGLILMVLYVIPSIRKVKEGRVDYSGSVYPPDMIPAMMMSLLLVTFLFEQLTFVDTVWGILFPIFLDIAVYFLLGILIHPLLRKKFSGKFCAAMWILPNILYLFTYPSYRPVPDFVISVGPYAEVLTWVWAAGFVFVLGAHIASHLRFRFKLLKNSIYVKDEKILGIWYEEMSFSKMKPKEGILQISPQVKAPLTIGLFKNSTVLLLPHLNYTEEQLRIIFRHEIVHLCKRDNAFKYFIAFCNAVCWFNPLMWGAMKRCAEDMERSCDEAVLYEADETERKKYAELILDTAADSKGFSTCLSSSASSLRYRLKQIMHPVNTKLEGPVLAVFLLLMGCFCGRLGFSYNTMPMNAVRLNEEKSIMKINGIWKDDHIIGYDILERFELEQPEQFLDYLSELNIEEMSWVYWLSLQSELGITIIFEDDRVYLDVAEIGPGLLIKEERRKGNFDKIYFVRGATLEEFTAYLN